MKPSVITGISTKLISREADQAERVDIAGAAILSILLFLSLGGMTVSFFHLSALPIFMPLFALIGAVTCVMFCYLHDRGHWSGFLSLGLLIVVILLFLVLQFIVKDGWYLVLNQICDALSYHLGRIFPVYDVSTGTRSTAGLLLLLTPFTILLALLCTRLVYCADWIVSTAVLLVILLCALIFDITPPMLWLLFFIFAVVLLLCRRLTVKNSVPAKGRAVIPLVLLLFVVAAVPCFAAWLAIDKDYVGGTEVKNTIVGQIAQWRYDGDANAMPNGDFSDLGILTFHDEPALEVTMSEPQSLYLRGYVGETYTGSGWTSLTAKQRYSGAGLFYWLHQFDFFGQSQLSLVASLADPGTEEIDLSIKNVGANSHYIYAPYELVANDQDSALFDVAKIGDEAVIADGFFGQRTYSYTSLTNQVKRYHELQYLLLNAEEEGDSEVLAYLENESSYRTYVYDNYLTIPENAREILATQLESYEVEEGSHPAYEEVKQKILSYLTENITYSEDGMPFANGEDFFQDFLEKYKEGYSVHYATAATLMFRYYGIPARYVEGYLITPDDIENVAAGQSVIINDDHSHAWVEVYQDGIGWIPFEVTPPYIDLMEQSNALQYENNGSEEESQDNEDTPDDEDDESDNYVPATSHTTVIILLSILSILILLLLAYLVYRLIKNKKALQALKASFAVEDNGEAIRRMFAYSLKILGRSGLRVGHGSLLDLFDVIETDISQEFALYFVKAALIQREAVFSRHTLTEEQRETVKQFMAESIAHLNDSSSRLKRFMMHRIQFFY